MSITVLLCASLGRGMNEAATICRSNFKVRTLCAEPDPLMIMCKVKNTTCSFLCFCFTIYKTQTVFCIWSNPHPTCPPVCPPTYQTHTAKLKSFYTLDKEEKHTQKNQRNRHTHTATEQVRSLWGKHCLLPFFLQMSRKAAKLQRISEQTLGESIWFSLV